MSALIIRATEFPRSHSLLHYIFSSIHFENVTVYLQSQKIIRRPLSSFPISGSASILSKTAIIKKQTIEKRNKLNLLNTVPFENSFHFFTEHGKDTGVTASSMVEFSEKLQTVPIQSVTFHFHRQDFQKWLKSTIGDEELAKRIDEIKAGFQEEDLRKELCQRVQNRIAELQQHR